MTHFPALRRLSAPALALLLLTGCTGTAATSGESAPSSAGTSAPTASAGLRGERAVVERVVDGDTVAVRLHEETVRVRLLNIDTPETKDPNEIVECLGPEATAFLEQLLPTGTVVGLEYDQERTDAYGRTLAGVFLQDGTLVNAEVARAGLGTPLYIAPNQRFLPPVEMAFAEAEQQQAGLLDPARGCTIPAQVQQATSALAGASPEDLVDAASGAAAAAAFLVALDGIDGDLHPHVRHLVELPRTRSGISSVRDDVASLRERGQEKRRKAEAEAARRTTPPAPGPAAPPAPPAPDPVPAAPAPAGPPAPAPAAPAPAVPDPPVVNLPPAPAPQPAPDPEANVVNEAPPGYYAGIPGYTGPRCYAPGGKFYRPC